MQCIQKPSVKHTLLPTEMCQIKLKHRYNVYVLIQSSWVDVFCYFLPLSMKDCPTAMLRRNRLCALTSMVRCIIRRRYQKVRPDIPRIIPLALSFLLTLCLKTRFSCLSPISARWVLSVSRTSFCDQKLVTSRAWELTSFTASGGVNVVLKWRVLIKTCYVWNLVTPCIQSLFTSL